MLKRFLANLCRNPEAAAWAFSLTMIGFTIGMLFGWVMTRTFGG